jgi:hypothetical protein
MSRGAAGVERDERCRPHGRSARRRRSTMILRREPGMAVGPPPSSTGLSNTRDQLRGAHDLTLVHDDSADEDAPTRLQPPLVSCIALLGGLMAPAEAAYSPCSRYRDRSRKTPFSAP